MFPSHSYEQAYQAIRRCWRFGQKEEVILDVIASPGEAGVIQNLQRKSKQVDRMFDSIVKYMNEELVIDRSVEFKEKVKVPSWL